MNYQNRSEVCQAIVDFVYELPNGYSNYPEHVLKLVSKYFDQHILTFIPTCLPYARIQKSKSDYWVSDYVTLNIEPSLLKEYNRYYHTKDIFRHSNLPSRLKYKPVLQIEEVLPYERFRQTEYYQFLQQHQIAHQSLLNLMHEDMYLGAIGIYHTEQQGSFSQEQIATFEIITRFIVQHYLCAIEYSRRNTILNMFYSDGYRDLTLGVVMLDSKKTVLQANHTAERYANCILAATRDDFVHKSAQGEESAFPTVQKMLNNLGNSVFYKNESFQLQAGDLLYEFHTSSFISPSHNLSKIESLYIVFININKGSSKPVLQLPHNFTSREYEIVELLAKGDTNQQISEKLNISIHTVKSHLLNIYKKANVGNRTALLNKLYGTS